MLNYVYVTPSDDYYTIVSRDNNYLYVRYGKVSLCWWHDISRSMIGR